MNNLASMMGGISLASWLLAALVAALVIAAAIALVRMLSPRGIEGASSIALLVLAVIGVLALLGGGGMFFMHWGMGGLMSCCG